MDLAYCADCGNLVELPHDCPGRKKRKAPRARKAPPPAPGEPRECPEEART